jgi:hypothetical protein
MKKHEKSRIGKKRSRKAQIIADSNEMQARRSKYGAKVQKRDKE